MRIKPRRETRGVSRSKCGDLITACVPVSWATSIIVNESTDAIDYFDGFGTTELVVGIRAYQWGWEYYYPKDLDLNYNIKPNYSTFTGNSLKYTKTTNLNLHSNNLWKFYQNKSFDHVITPAHLLAIPLDNYKLVNFMNFNDIGLNQLQESHAFKKIRMFSKTYTSSLTFIPNNYSNKYKNLSELYINENSYVDSYLYGLKRQHNFLSIFSIFNNYSTFFNLNSVNKLVNFNFNNSFQSFSKSINNYNLTNFFKKTNNSNLNNQFLRINNFFFKYSNSFELNNLNNFSSYSNILNLINDDTDKKKTNYPIFKLFNLTYKKKNNLLNYQNLNKLNDFADINLLINNNESFDFFNNKNINFKTFLLFSNNQSISLTDRNTRKFLNTKPTFPNLNHSTSLNSINTYISLTKNLLTLNNVFFLFANNSNWIDLNTSLKLNTNRLNYDYPYSPISSNNSLINTFNHDSHKHSFIEGTPSILQGKEELMPGFLQNIYWNFYWSNTSTDWRLNNKEKYFNLHDSFYLPTFSFYYDYDFRNWQSFELLEDSFWEATNSIYNYDEYLSLTKDFYNYEYFDKAANYYNEFNRELIFKEKILNKPLLLNTLMEKNSEIGAISFYLDDFVNPTNLIPSKDFFIFPTTTSFTNVEDNFDSFKNLYYLYNNNNKLFLNIHNNFINHHASSFVLDSYRSDFDDFAWFFDENNFFMNNSFIEINKFNANLIKSALMHDLNLSFDFNILKNHLNLENDKSLRFSNNINLRNTTKNAIVTHNAIQKVFKTRFDENRSHTKLYDFSNFYTLQPYLSSERVHYENILGKNKESFFKVNFYKNNFKTIYNNLNDLTNSLNFYFYDFPFLLAFKSDSSRYLWFDWFSKWGFYEVQPSSSSRYAIFGMPYFSKNFEFSTVNGEVLNESENYLTRIAKARKNYLPNWTYTPYFYAKNNSWYKNNIMFDLFNQSINPLNITFYALNSMNWYWNDLFFINYHYNQFFPSNSGINSYARSSWKPQNSIQAYYRTVSELIDILTKREYLYRELFSTNKKITSLPYYLTNSPRNPLINEIKNSLFFVDKIVINNEYSRDAFYTSLDFFNFIVLKSFLLNHFNFLNLNALTNYLFYYFLDTPALTTFNNNAELYKNQYRPMRKGVTNMIRLHATGAMALPIEIRLQVLASSKDVIHSWAIPSAGIKIDCVPGYSSHRVMIFLVSGIFWGQCMEVCGRYHHWMPIIVYFMKRDLFFLWCTHFIFLSGSNNMWNINDRQYADYARLASFDKNSWLSELNS